MKKLTLMALSIALCSYGLFGKNRTNNHQTQRHDSIARDQEAVQGFANQINIPVGNIPGTYIPASLQPEPGTPRPNQQVINAIHQTYINTQATAHRQATAPVTTHPTRVVPFDTRIASQEILPTHLASSSIGASSSRNASISVDASSSRDINTTVRPNDARFIGEARERRQTGVARVVREAAHEEQSQNDRVQGQNVIGMINQIFPTPSAQQQNDRAQRQARLEELLQLGRDFIAQNQDHANHSDSEHSIERPNG